MSDTEVIQEIRDRLVKVETQVNGLSENLKAIRNGIVAFSGALIIAVATIAVHIW